MAGKPLSEISVAQARFLDRFRTMLKGPGPFVTDGTPLSSLPYGRALIGPLFDGPAGAAIRRHAERLADAFDLIVWLPPEADLVDDGFRPLDEGFRAQMDEGVLQAIGDRVFMVATGSLEDRAALVLHAIGAGRAPPRRRHVAFEGLPRSGKSTVMGRVQKILAGRGVPFHPATRPARLLPDGRHVQERLHDLYRDASANRDELLQLFTDTFLHHRQANATDERLAAGALVLSDRQRPSILAMMRAAGHAWGPLYRATRALPMAGCVLFLDADPAVCVARARRTGESHNLKTSLPFQDSVAEAYRWLAEHHVEIHRINATRPIGDVTEEALATIERVALEGGAA